ncbi:MAG: hypothetical protein ACYCZC_11910 [Acidithiobacillus sp.]
MPAATGDSSKRGLTLWLPGLRAWPGEALGEILPRYWGRGRRERLPAATLLDLAARLWALPAGPVPAGALLAAADGVAVDGRWVIALEAIQIQSRQGQAVVLPMPSEALQVEEVDTLLAAARAHFAGADWEIVGGGPSGRWYVLAESVPDLQSTPIFSVLGREPLDLLPKGRDAGYWNGIFNELQMLLTAHPVNQRREEEGLEPLRFFWAWGEGCLPQIRPVVRWQGLVSPTPWLRALAAWAGVPLLHGLEALPEAEMETLWAEVGELLWEWPADWRLDETAPAFAAIVPVLDAAFAAGASVQLWSGVMADGMAERVRLRPGDRWRFWRRAVQPGTGAAFLGQW